MASAFRIHKKGQLLKCIVLGTQIRRYTTTQGCTRMKRILLSTLGVIGGGVATFFYALEQSSVEASAYVDQAHWPDFPWSHNGTFDALDHASMRRGYEVYKQICKACHSCHYIAFRNLVGVTHTEAEAKAEAAEVMIRDGPDETGEYFERPGRLSDYFPDPYPNENAARYANGGAFPPDLSFIGLSREGGDDYLFSLLTGYIDTPPAGINLREGQHYNPFFPGGALAMAKVLNDDAIDYADGTCATSSQMAKDVVTFLRWVAEPDLDDRRLMSIRFVVWFPLATLLIWYLTRHKWSSIKSRKIVYKPVKK